MLIQRELVDVAADAFVPDVARLVIEYAQIPPDICPYDDWAKYSPTP